MAVYFLILVGGIVRTTGSGMGCPDWPKCFGRWAPPSTAAELPDNYREIHAASREKKNAKFIKYLRAFGFSGTADRLANDQSVRTETEFNPAKAWIEYLNRLVGVVIGFFIIALFYRSIKFRITNPPLFYLSLLTLLGVILQGWFGSIVVSTNLTSWTITLHMFLALAIVGLLVKILSLSEASAETYPVGEIPAGRNSSARALRVLVFVCMALVLLQVLFGTEVRESIDSVAGILPRSKWIEAVGGAFILHRSFSLIVLFAHVVLVVRLRKTTVSKTLPRALIILILGTLLTGVGMAWFSVPAVLQPLHLTLATSTFGVQLYLFFSWGRSRQRGVNPAL